MSGTKRIAMLVGPALAAAQMAGLELVPVKDEPNPVDIEPTKVKRPHIGKKQIAKALKRKGSTP